MHPSSFKKDFLRAAKSIAFAALMSTICSEIPLGNSLETLVFRRVFTKVLTSYCY